MSDAPLTSALRSQIAVAIDESLDLWRRGENASPSSTDHVLDALRILAPYLPDAIDEGPVADELDAWMIDETPETTYAIAAWLLGRLLPTWEILLPNGEAHAMVAAVDGLRALDEYSEIQGFAPYSTNPEMRDAVYTHPDTGNIGATFTNYDIQARRVDRSNVGVGYSTTTLAEAAGLVAEAYIGSDLEQDQRLDATIASLPIDEIAEEAVQAAFRTIADGITKATGLHVTGDFDPLESHAIDETFRGYVRSMARNVVFPETEAQAVARDIASAERDGVTPDAVVVDEGRDEEALARHRRRIADRAAEIADEDSVLLDQAHDDLTVALRNVGLDSDVLHTGGGCMVRRIPVPHLVDGDVCVDVNAGREVWLTRDETWLVGFYDFNADECDEGVCLELDLGLDYSTKPHTSRNDNAQAVAEAVAGMLRRLGFPVEPKVEA